MAVRERRTARTGRSLDLDRPVVIFDQAPDRPPRRARRRMLAAALLVVLGVAAIGAASWWVTRGDEVVATRPAAQAPVEPPPNVTLPAALAVTVAAPATVVAGQPARFVVSYADGSGIFSGSTQDWGEVGVGSVKERACAADTSTAAAIQGSYVATHKWRSAGSYPVSFAVTTYTCSKGSNGQATQETNKAQLTVVVAAR
jgi:hypothetical protein